jgi:porin
VRVFAPWYEAKREIREQTGLSFGLQYQTVFLAATAGITDSSQQTSASGVFNVPIQWTLLARGTGWDGTFTIVMENRHVYGNYSVAPQNLAFETGTILPTAVKFGDMDFRVLVMHWSQSLFNDRAAVVVGQLAPDDYFNHYQLIHPFFNHYSLASSITSAGNWPNPGFGIAAGGRITEQFFAKAMLGEAGGYRFADETLLHFGDNFFKGHFFKVVEVGWVASRAERFARRISLTAMHVDAYEESPDENVAFALASNWAVGGRWVPFVLAGVGNGKGENALAKQTVTAGMAHNFRTTDVASLSLNWTNPVGDLRQQLTVETFYRFQVNPRFGITPDIQLVFNPALNTAKSVIAYFGVRARVDL